MSAIYLFLCLLLVAWAALHNNSTRYRYAAPAIIFSGFLLLFINRWPLLYYDQAINPDEAMMAANAMLVKHGWLNWNLVDPQSAGPLDSWILAWPNLFGADITLFTTRLTGVIILGLTFVFFYAALRHLTGNPWVALTIIPFYAFFISTRSEDFLHYASEVLSIFLIALGLYFYARAVHSKRLPFMLASAFFFGCVPMAKFQGAPVALVGGGFLLFEAWQSTASRNQRICRIAAVIVVACIPSAVFLVPLAILGGIDDFIHGYFLQTSWRIHSQKWSDKVPSLIKGDNYFWMMLDCYLAMALFGVIALYRRAGKLKITADEKRLLTLASIMTPVCYFVSALSGRPFAHYLFFLIPSFILVGGASFIVMRIQGEKAQPLFLRYAALVIGAALTFDLIDTYVIHKDSARPSFWSFALNDVLFLEGKPFQSPHLLQWAQPNENDHILCWGWRSQCYVDTALRPAARETTSENQLYNGPYRDYFRRRLLTDLAISKPDFVIDLVAPGSFFFNDPQTQSIATFPDLQDLVERDYQLVSSVKHPKSCPRLYVRKTRWTEIEAKLVPIASITATQSMRGFDPASLDDKMFFETCRDYWLAPNGVGGSLRIKFAEPSPVTSVELLNTRNGPFVDRASKRLEIRFMYQGEVVRKFEVNMNRYPYWTNMKLDEPIPEADEMDIDVLSYEGLSGGLNEVKVFQ